MSSLRQPLPFPHDKPHDYIRLQDEPTFQASRHLALEAPRHTVSLTELGYDEAVAEQCPSPLALTSPFRIFSDEGLAVVQTLCERMKSNRNKATATGQHRLGAFIRGAGYRSQFIRDFCESRELLDFLSAIAGLPLARHTVPAVACGINYAPEDIRRAVDTWHVDSVGFDAVILLTDPSTFRGGEFQYFRGSKEEGEQLLGGKGEEGTQAELPAERVHTMDFGAAGCGFMQQGNMVFHRACRLLEKADRVTMIPSFVGLRADKPENTNVAAMSKWGDPGIITELARHEAWLTRHRLQEIIDSLPVDADIADVQAATEKAAAGLNNFAAHLRQLNNKQGVT